MDSSLVVTGVVVQGHCVASRPSRDYPYAALAKQKPYFLDRGLDISHFYQGTLNISIAPKTFRMLAPRFNFPLVPWTDLHPPETFSFSPCIVSHQGRKYAGMVYYPHPETKIRHFQDASLIEVLAEFIPGIGYGVKLELIVNPGEIQIV